VAGAAHTDTQGLEMFEEVMISVGVGTKKDCAGEGQEQFTRPADSIFILVKLQNAYGTQNIKYFICNYSK
jgi:hypothetical protein